MKFFSVAVVGCLLFFGVATEAATPQEWFDKRGWDTAGCEIETESEQSGSRFFSLSMNNPFSTDIRLGYWQESKSRIKIYGAQQPNTNVKWRVRDWDKFYVLDVVKRKCVNALRFTYADEGSTVMFSRGMNPSDETALQGETTERTQARAA